MNPGSDRPDGPDPTKGMNLGSSLRRRRGGGPRRGSILDSSLTLRTGGLAVLATLAGLGLGYLVAVSALWPAPADETDLLEVPDLRGTVLSEARTTLEQERLALGAVDSIHHPSAEEGVVLGQSPLPGQLAAEGAGVALTLSLGPERRPVPDVSRLRADRARAVLEATGFAVEVDSVDAEVPRGWVAGVFPEVGTEVTLPDTVALDVSLGPPQVVIPRLVGLQQEEATALLDSLGLFVTRVDTRFPFGRFEGMVLEHEPGAGETVDRGAAVRLVVGRRGIFRQER